MAKHRLCPSSSSDDEGSSGSWDSQQENCHKRASTPHECGRDAAVFLQQAGLWDYLRGCDAATQQYWLATAQLNVLLRAFQMDFDRLTVLERRPLARLPKTAALGQYSCAEGDELPEQQHMGALCMALDAACSDCSDVAIEQLTLVVSPPWLAAWASQWLPHCPSGGAQRLRLTVVQGYAAEKAPLRASTVYNIGQPPMTTTAPHKTVYLPLIGC